MRPTIRVARRACEAAKARQAIVVWFDGDEFAVASYGQTKAECRAARRTCDAIADAIATGKIPRPGDGVPRTLHNEDDDRAD